MRARSNRLRGYSPSCGLNLAQAGRILYWRMGADRDELPVASNELDVVMSPLAAHQTMIDDVSDASRRYLLEKARQLMMSEPARDPAPADDFPRLTSAAIQKTRMPRSRDRIMENLETMYREAFERAKATGDEHQMATLDFAYRREQLYLEILLDIRDAADKR